MIRGIYTSATGLLLDQRRLEVTANNLANVNTTGFKRDTVVARPFQEMLITRMNDESPQGLPQNEPIGRMGMGVMLLQASTRLTDGTLKETGNPLDAAIVGDGFFAVAGADGTKYTRQGAFRQDSTGTLVTADGSPVLVDGGIIQAEFGTMQINDNGEVLAAGTVLGRLTVLTSQELGAIRKEGEGFWVQAGQPDENMLVPAAATQGRFAVRAGFLEASNVEAVTEMVEMISTMRSFEAGQKALQAQDETLAKAVTEIARM